MKWTSEKPKEAGWYWWRSDETGPIILEICKRDGVLEYLNGYGWMSTEFLVGGEWLGPISPDDRQQGRVEAVNVDALVERFLTWPLPASVCSDLCTTKQGYPHRTGTSLLSAVEAKAMLEHVLGIEQLAQQAQEGGVGDGTK